MAGVDGFQTIKFVDGPPPESFTDDNPMADLNNFEQDENNFENQSNLDTLYNSPNTTNWDEVTPMTGSHIPGVDTGAHGGETTFVGGGGQVQTIGSGMGSFGDGGGASSNAYVAPECSSTAATIPATRKHPARFKGRTRSIWLCHKRTERKRPTHCRSVI